MRVYLYLFVAFFVLTAPLATPSNMGEPLCDSAPGVVLGGGVAGSGQGLPTQESSEGEEDESDQEAMAAFDACHMALALLSKPPVWRTGNSANGPAAIAPYRPPIV